MNDKAKNDSENDIDIPFVRRGFFVYPVAVLVLLGFMVMAMSRSIFVYVLPGEIGVLYDPLAGGTQTMRVYHEGLVIKAPWSRFFTYDTRLQNSQHYLHALSNEGMAINVELSVLFRPEPEFMGRLHKELGPDYRTHVIAPIVIAAVREVISRNGSHTLYTTDFDLLHQEIAAELRMSAVSDMIDFVSVLITKLELPPSVLQAIEHKLQQEQITASYKFVLQSQWAEAERKRIEAIGIQNFYAIVSSALTEQLLTWRGIEATVELARSPNSKIVVVGSGKDQLPLILGGEIGQLPPGPPAPVVQVPPDAFPLSPSVPLGGAQAPLLFPSTPAQIPFETRSDFEGASPADGSERILEGLDFTGEDQPLLPGEVQPY